MEVGAEFLDLVPIGGEVFDGLCGTAGDVDKILQGLIALPDEDFRLFAYSETYFSHDKWICWDPDNRRHIASGPENRTINWTHHSLPEKMIDEIKRITWANFVISNTMPMTVGNVKSLMLFLSELLSNFQGQVCPLSSLSDLRLTDIKVALGNTKNSRFIIHKNVYPLIKFMAHPFVQKYTGVKIHWKRADVKNLPWDRFNSDDHKRGSRDVLSSACFLYRSNLNRALVRDFLEAVGETPEDIDPNPEFDAKHAAGDLLLQRHPSFEPLFQAYIDSRGKPSFGPLYQAYMDARGKDYVSDYVMKADDYAFRGSEANRQAHPGKIMGDCMSQGTMRGLLNLARYAAQLIVSMYTGMRESDQKGIWQPVGATGDERCIRCENGMWFLYATHVKGEGEEGTVGQDRWVAPAVIRDAIRVLEIQQPILNNPYLFSTINATSIHGMPCNNLTATLKRRAVIPQLAGTEFEDEVKDWTHHTDRNSLTKELYAAGVQLVHISRQLHHTHTMLGKVKASETTLGYGGLGKRPRAAVRTNPGLSEGLEEYKEEAKRKRYHDILGEDANIAGTGSDVLKYKIDTAFLGMGYAGQDRADYIDLLVEAGFPLPTSGFGVCGQQAFEMEDEPPCMGDYECDPNCKSCIVTPDRKYQVIKEFRRAIHMQHNDSQAHNRRYWVERERVFTKLLLQLDEDPSEIKQAFLAERNEAEEVC